MQALGELHETADSELPSESRPFGLGVASIVQLVPFQRSASVAGLPKPTDPGVIMLLRQPTAVHAVREAHDTPTRLISPAAPIAGLGVGCTVQLVPFHRSANDSSLPAPFV